MENIINRWKSKDFYLCCIIRASGYNLICIDRQNHDFCVFTFDINPQNAEKIISHHWSRQLKLPTKDLIEAIHELRTRLKNNI